MNYGNVKVNNKSKIAIIVISIIMVVALATAFIAIISNGFTKKPNGWLKKDVPSSTFVLGVSSIDEIIGVPFDEESFSFSGTDKDSKNYEYSWAILNLSVDGFGEEFVFPEDGNKVDTESYLLTIRLNGDTFELTNYIGGYMFILDTEDTEERLMIVLGDYAYLSAEGVVFVDMNIGDEIYHYGNNVLIPGVSLGIISYADTVTDFEILGLEKVG